MKRPLDFIDAGASDDEPVKGVTQGDLRRWHDKIQEAFDLGFKAAGGAIYPINEDPSGQRREPMSPRPSWDDEPPFQSTMEHIARDIRDGIFPKKSP